MRLKSLLLVVLLLGPGMGLAEAATGSAAPRPEGDVVARIHFVGMDHVFADTNGASMKNLGALPETAALREQTLQKLATTPFRLLQKRHPQEQRNQAALFRPLLEDFLSAEWFLEMRGPTNPFPELVMALHLDSQRAELWQKNLSTILSAWTGMAVKEIQVEGFKGWELRKHHNPDLIRLIRAGDWVVFGWGQDELSLQPGILQRIKETKRPVAAAKDYWLDAWVDWPRLEPSHPTGLPFKLPATQLTVEGRNNYLRPKLTMQFPAPLGLSLEPWRIPTNLVHNPMVSFTAFRGVGHWLQSLPFLKELNIGPIPDEWFVWARDRVPYATCMASPVKGGMNTLEQAATPGFLATLNAKLAGNKLMGSVRWSTNHTLMSVGSPFIAPFILATNDSSGDFLYGSFFATPPSRSPVPAALIKEIMSRPNLVYYDWELTQGRLSQWHSLSTLYFLINGRISPATNTPAQNWLTAVSPKLGNCATVITQTAPNELTLIRNSGIGLTAVEMTLLAYWLDARGFPLDAHVDAPLVPAFSSPPPPGR